jgi:hypothetical protein
MNGVLWAAAWILIGACQTLADLTENLAFLPTRAGLRQVFFKYIDWDLNVWAKEVGRRVSIIVDAYNRTGEIEIGLSQLSGALMHRIARVERIDAVAATALHYSYIRSRDRKIPARWQENLRLAAGFQVEFLKAWQNAPGWGEFLGTVDQWTHLIVKTVVNGGALGIAHAMEKTESLVVQGMNKFAIKGGEAYARATAEPFAKGAELPSRAADLLQTFVYARVTLKEYMQLLAIKEGLACVIALLYDAEMDDMTGASYNPAPEEGEEEPEPLRPPDPTADAARLSRILAMPRSELPSSPGAQATVGVDDVDVLKRVREFLAQPESPDEADKRLRQEAVEYAEQVIRESGVRWSHEQRQTLIESRIKTLQIKRLLSPSPSSISQEQPNAGGQV